MPQESTNRRYFDNAFTKGRQRVSRYTEQGRRRRVPPGLSPKPSGAQPDDEAYRTDRLGFQQLENPLFLEIFDHFTRRLQQRGLQPLLANLTEGEPPDGALNMLRQYSVDGVIVASSPLHRKLLSACTKAGLPAVQAFGRPGGRIRANVVAADNVQGGRVAADLFCERGYRRVAFLGGPLSATSTEDRLQGFRQRLLSERLRPVVEVYADSFS